MNNKRYVGRRVGRFESHGQIRAIDGIALVVDEDHEYRAGDMDGYVLEIACPYGTRVMADGLLEQLRGKNYTGYTAENAVMDPESELGDGVTLAGVYTLLARRDVTFGSGHLGEISAPADSDLDHEYAAADPYTRQIERKLAATRSYIDKTAEDIRIGVEGVQGDVAELKVSVGSISSTVSGYDGRISKVEQTAEDITAEIDGLDSKYILKSNWNSLTSSFVTSSGLSSQIRQEVSNISLSVTGSLGGTASISITAGGSTKRDTLDLSGVRTSFANDDTDITISAGTVRFNTGTFLINTDSSGRIRRTGNISISSDGFLWTNKAEFQKSELHQTTAGYAFPYSMPTESAMATDGDIDLLPLPKTSGSGFETYSASVYGYAGASGAGRVELIYASYLNSRYWACVGYDCNIYLRSGVGSSNIIKADRGIDESSDRDIKRDITELDERYLTFIDNIPPVSFRYKEQPDDAPFAVGYIAQDVEAALGKAGMTRADFSGIVGTDGEGDMALGYTQFIPILHLKINDVEKKTDTRLNDLEKRLKRLEETA